MRVSCAILTCLLAGAAHAQDLEPPPETPPEDLRFTSLAVYWENDGAYIKPNHYTDEHYTNGLKIDFGFEGQLADTWAARIPTAPIVGIGTAEGTQLRGAVGMGVSQLMFTPEDLERRDLIEDDRPYAGYLGFNFFLQRVSDGRIGHFEHFELDVGVVGPASYAREIQEQVHAIFPGNIDPGGWNHQLSNEPVLNAGYRRRWRFDLIEPDAPLGLQLIPGGGFEVGNMNISARVDTIARFGWNLPQDFGPPRILDLRDITARPGLHTDAGDWSLYAYGRAAGRAVAYDIFLDGNAVADSHRVEREPFVAEFQVGLVARWRFLEIGYGQTWVSREFEQENPSSHGALTATLHFPF